ncbi:MAG: hypothetical protein GKS00_12695 [Alphaproteobacteria bacterium]|nr:hypothetical protein [Alphaproteobacteria bacterium]
MRTLTKTLIAVGVVAGIGGLALIPPGFANGGKRYFGSHHGGGHHDGMSGRGMRLFERFDANKDGAVNQAEIDKTRADLIVRFDADQDGKLSLKEFEGLWLDFTRDRMVDRFQHLDRNGDAIVTSEEFSYPMQNIISRLDRDDDGQLTAKEMMRQRGGGHDGGRKMRRDHDDDHRR